MIKAFVSNTLKGETRVQTPWCKTQCCASLAGQIFDTRYTLKYIINSTILRVCRWKPLFKAAVEQQHSEKRHRYGQHEHTQGIRRNLSQQFNSCRRIPQNGSPTMKTRTMCETQLAQQKLAVWTERRKSKLNACTCWFMVEGLCGVSTFAAAL